MKKSDIEDTLHGIITTALGAPGGDPDHVHSMVAAMAYLALDHFDCDMRDLKEPYDEESGSTKDFLEGKNIYKRNFLTDVTWDGHYTDKYRNG